VRLGVAHLLAGVAALATLPAHSATPAQCEEAATLRTEHALLRRTIADIALGRGNKRKGISAAGAGQAVAGIAATLLLPFGIGALASAGASAAIKDSKKRKAKPEAPGPDVPALIARQQEIEDRLGELPAAGCT
jgi:hypothetical protein